MIYNNNYGGTGKWYGVALSVYRACPPLLSSTWGVCDGTKYQLGSRDLKSSASRVSCLLGSGLCLDGISFNSQVQFCSNHRDTECISNSDCTGGGTCTAYFDGDGPGGYPCRDQPGRTHDQLLSPVFVWNNSCGAGCTIGVTPNSGSYSCGLGIGNYLVAGRDYFADGTKMPGYLAFTYPHPLQTGQIGPQPPTNLTVTTH